MKKIVSTLLIFAILLSCFAFSSCKKEPAQNKPTKKPIEYNLDDSFETRLMSFVNNEIGNENYVISSLSFRYALALAAYGAEGETLEKLLIAAGFTSLDECKAWVKKMNQFAYDFAEATGISEDMLEYYKYYYDEEEIKKYYPNALIINNSVWHLTDAPGTIKESFIKTVKDDINADAYNVTRKEILKKLNKWVNENTNGNIPSLLSDVPKNLKTVLVNALYLNASWVKEFDEFDTEKDYFTTFSGRVTKKEFMYQQDDFNYYEDEETQVLIMPLKGDIQAIFVIGNTDGLDTKIKEATYETVSVKLPKFEIETSFDNNELLTFLLENGAGIATDENNADFSNMIEGESVYIDAIVQKAKIDLCETGIEAAASTATDFSYTSAEDEPEPKKIYYFNADKPFSFFICANLDNKNPLNNLELLFNGKVVS